MKLSMLAWLVWALAACSSGPGLERFEFAEPHMGTRFKVVMYAPDRATADAAAAEAFARVAALNDILSDYQATSELRRLSATSGSGQAVEVSDDMYAVLERSLAFSRMSDGAFDVTVGPVVRLWRHARRHEEMPRGERLDEALASVGYEHVVLDPQRRTVKLTAAEMRLDVGGIAKGYTCDAVLAVLAKHGVTRALVDAGGDLSFADPPPDRDAWRIALPQLLDPADAPKPGETGQPGLADIADAPVEYLHLANAAVATSGDVFQHVVIDGVRYSHLVNPKTGIGLTTPMTVTVVAPDGTTADALASTVSVLGPDKGLALVDTMRNTAARVRYLDEDNKLVTRVSKRWRRLTLTTERE